MRMTPLPSVQAAAQIQHPPSMWMWRRMRSVIPSSSSVIVSAEFA